MQELRVGQSWVRFEPPDMLVEKIVGELSEADARAILAAGEKFTERAADIYILGDISCLATLRPEVRRLVREYRPSPKIRAMALVGPSSPARTLTMLLMKAVSLVWEQATNVQFFDTEEEALAWFAEVRRARAPRSIEAAEGG